MKEEKNIKREFADKYIYNLHSYVLPTVKQFENERKIRFAISLAIAILIAAIAAISIALCIFMALKTNNEYKEYLIFKPFLKFGAKKLILIAFFGGIYIWKKIQQDFEYKVKNKIMPVLISAFDGFKWVDIPSDEYYDDILNSDIYPYFDKKTNHAYPDYFLGSYKDVTLEFSQALYNSDKYSFNGGMIRIRMNKNFSGETILRPKGVFHKDLIKMGLQKVLLEDDEFNKKFEIYSTDQVEARYLLTPAFMERLKNISVQFTNSNKIYCAFKNNYIYISPESKQDMFALFGLTKRADDIKNFEILFAQINSVVDLVDYFKLNEKTGL